MKIKALYLILIFFSLNTMVYCQAKQGWSLVCEKADFSPRDCGGSYNIGLVFDGKIWISGGYNWEYLDVVPDQWCSSDGSHWTQVNSMSDIYALNLVYKNKLWQTSYHIRNSENGIDWDTLGISPEYGYTVLFKNKIWLIGTSAIYSTDNFLNWKLERDSLPWPKRTSNGVLVYNDRIWIIGGINYPNLNETYNDVWSSDDGVNWSQVTANADWSPRRFFTPVSYKGKLWVIAGQDTTYPDGKNSGNLNEVWYSSDGAKWYKYYGPGSSFLPRHAPFTLVFNDNIYVIGGYANNGVFYNDIWKLNINKLSITSEPIKTARLNSLYSYSVHADFSIDNDAIKYRLVNSPSWMSIDSISGTVRGYPTSCCVIDSTVSVEAYTSKGESDIQTFHIQIINPEINALISSSGPISFCKGGSTTLSSVTNYSGYKWNTGDTSQKITVNRSGDYFVVIKDENGCLDSSNIITINALPHISITSPSNNYVCYGDSILLTTTDNFDEYHWSTGDTSKSVYVKRAEDYYVVVKDWDGCSDTSNIITLNVKPLPAPVVITNDTLCAGKMNFLSTGQYHDFLWSNGKTTRVTEVDQPGTYSVWVTDYHGCHNRSDSVYVKTQPEVKIIPRSPTTFCVGDSTLLFCSSTSYPLYHWNSGENTPDIVAKSSGDYYLTVTDDKGCKGNSDTIEIRVNQMPIPVYPNPTTGIVKIELNELRFVEMDLYLMDLKGLKILHRKIINGENIIELDLSKLTNGFYILSLEFQNRSILVEKILKSSLNRK